LTKKFVKDSVSQFQNFHLNYHKFHALFSRRLSQLGYAITSFAQDGLNILTGAHKMWRMASALIFLERCHEDGDEFLNHIIIPVREHCNQRTVKAVDAHTFTKQAKEVSTTVCCQKAAGNCLPGHHGTTMTPEAYLETLKKTA
jgi:hypothetical protein